MGLKQREWAANTRDRLMQILGGVCRRCGGLSNLQFDCIIPQGDEHHKREWSWRMSFYRGQWRNGNLQILCEECHGRKSAKENPNVQGECPF